MQTLNQTTADFPNSACGLIRGYRKIVDLQTPDQTIKIIARVRTHIYFHIFIVPRHLLSNDFRPDLMVKKLRYYARFIVVCLLLKKMKLVRDLVRELAKHIDEYTATYEPEDQLEWSLVLTEIKSFIEADTIVNVLDSDSNSIVLSHR